MTPTLIGIDLACPGEDYSVQVTIAKSGEWRCRRIEKKLKNFTAPLFNPHLKRKGFKFPHEKE